MPFSLLNVQMTDISPSIIKYHYNNLESNAKYLNDVPTCLLLRPVNKIDRGLVRSDRPSKNPRGPYSKDLFSYTGGRPQVSTSKKTLKLLGLPMDTYYQKTLQASHVVLLYHDKPFPVFQRRFYQASHLCGNKACINVDHLIWERYDYNVSREMCHVHKEPKCEHSPPCITSHNQ